MIVLDGFLMLLVFYVISGLATFIYSLLKNYELVGLWFPDFDEKYIGVIEYPKWLMFWIYGIYSFAKKIIKKVKCKYGKKNQVH